MHDQNQVSTELFNQYNSAGNLYLKLKDYLNAEKYLEKAFRSKGKNVNGIKFFNINRLIEVKISLGKENEGIEGFIIVKKI